MGSVVRFVDVQTGQEVSRATLADDGNVDFEGGESAKGVVEQLMRVDDTDAAAAMAKLAKYGWSNGYLMVALDGLDVPVAKPEE